MKQQLKITYTPYCYLIGWSKLNKYYYGVRYTKRKYHTLYDIGCHPDELWKTYFTSSEYVQSFRLKYGEPDIIQVRKTFKCPKKAIAWESKFLVKVNASTNPNWINKHVNGAIYMDHDVIAKKRQAMLGRTSILKGKTKAEITKNPDWVSPFKGKSGKERYGEHWVCPLKGKTMKERLNNPNYIDPRSEPFTIISHYLGELTFNNVAECKRKTKLDNVTIRMLKTGKTRTIKRRCITKHIFPDGDVIKLK